MSGTMMVEHGEIPEGLPNVLGDARWFGFFLVGPGRMGCAGRCYIPEHTAATWLVGPGVPVDEIGLCPQCQVPIGFKHNVRIDEGEGNG